MIFFLVWKGSRKRKKQKGNFNISNQQSLSCNPNEISTNQPTAALGNDTDDDIFKLLDDTLKNTANKDTNKENKEANKETNKDEEIKKQEAESLQPKEEADKQTEITEKYLDEDEPDFEEDDEV